MHPTLTDRGLRDALGHHLDAVGRYPDELRRGGPPGIGYLHQLMAMTDTLGRRRTGTRSTPTLAMSPMWAGWSCVPAATTTQP